MSSRKRKHTRRGSPDYNTGGEQSSPQSSSSNALFVQGHEATIIRGRPDFVQALTRRDPGGGKGGLIQWHGDCSAREHEVWVDRYDARLLLDSLPTTDPHTVISASPPSPTGWSDLPSDSEDTFFFSPAEIETFHREKRRKLMDAGREERLRAMRESDADPIRDFEDDRELWGGDEEEPEDAQRTLMERTAKHLLTSPNPGQLEMRILANHGSDQRFAFLRGRWRNSWQTIKLVAKAEKDQLERKQMESAKNVGGGLVAYEDSDDSDAGHSSEHAQNNELVRAEAGASVEAEEKEKEARRVRAREWVRQRKAGMAGGLTPQVAQGNGGGHIRFTS